MIPKSGLIKAFMAFTGYNDTGHPAVQLLDLQISTHPEYLRYTNYAVVWLVLNVLTVLFTLYLGIKLVIHCACWVTFLTVKLFESVRDLYKRHLASSSAQEELEQLGEESEVEKNVESPVNGTSEPGA